MWVGGAKNDTGCGAARTPHPGCSAQPPSFSAVDCSEPSTLAGLPVTAVPIVFWTWVLTWAHAVLLGYCTDSGRALMKEPKIGSLASALAAETVAGSRSYSRSNCSWYLSW